jgi:hypothetical protein
MNLGCISNYKQIPMIIRRSSICEIIPELAFTREHFTEHKQREFLNIFPQNANKILTGAMENTSHKQIFLSVISRQN